MNVLEKYVTPSMGNKKNPFIRTDVDVNAWPSRTNQRRGVGGA